MNLFENNHGLLHLKGRFANSSLIYEEQHPVILRGKESYFTRQLSGTLTSPTIPDLAEYRIEHLTLALRVTGLDFAGPLCVRNGAEIDQVYILQTTCASSRAIHLEKVPAS